MSAKASSPTSLLWAHQLKREHGYLLKRMQDLETNSESQAKRLKTAESAAKSSNNADVATLAKKIKALDESGIGTRFTNLEREMKERTEELEAGSEAITLQVAAMQKDAEERDDEKRKAFTKEKALLKRIGELETGLQTYEQALVQMGRKLDGTRMEEIKAQLKGLTEQVGREGAQMKRLEESIAVLGNANEELKKANLKLTAEMEKVQARSAATAKAAPPKDVTSIGGDDSASSTTETSPRKTKKTKTSHKWSGGGADRDVIVTGERALAISQPALQNTKDNNTEEESAVSEESPPRKKPPRPKQKFKPTPPHLRPPPDPSKPKAKSHKWSGGWDKDIINSGNKILRSGPGWVEYAETIDSQQSEGAQTQSSGRQPKKRTETPRWTVEEAMTQGRMTRGARQPRAEVETQQAVAKTTRMVKMKKEALDSQHETAAPAKRRPAQEVIASPPSTSRTKAPQAAAAPPPRRRIRQDE